MSTEVQVDYVLDRYYTTEPNLDDDWDRGNTAADWHVKGIRVVNENGNELDFHDFMVGFDVNWDKTYFLVVADYSTGDSFGHDDNQLEFVDLFETEEKANACAYRLRESNDWDVYYDREGGERIKYHVPWHGYFEHLNEIQVIDVRRRS